MATFKELGLTEPILEALQHLGYDQPTPIQEQTIPMLLSGRDVIGQAQTGTGKTAAFGLPLLQYVDGTEDAVQALVLTPTRELCIQVTQALRAYGARKGIDVVAVFGGAPIRSQQAQLRAGGQVVVGTVGRVRDLISRRSIILSDCRFLVLDEADEMLDLGFFEDVEKIISLTPGSRQTALFSATVPREVRQLADNYLLDPVTIRVEAATLTIDTVEQFYLQCKRDEKVSELVRILEAEQPHQAIVFVRTKIRCDQLYRTLRDKGLDVKALHGDMSQGSRDGVMISFKDGRLRILVATDVAARGLDISAVTLVEPRQRRELEAIERHARTTIAPWIEGAHVKPEPVVERPHRHAKPHLRRNGREPHRKLIVGAGRAAGLEVADLVTAITRATGLDGEAVRNVRVLERFSFLEVPESDVSAVLERVNGTEVRGTRLALETAAG